MTVRYLAGGYPRCRCSKSRRAKESPLSQTFSDLEKSVIFLLVLPHHFLCIPFAIRIPSKHSERNGFSTSERPHHVLNINILVSFSSPLANLRQGQTDPTTASPTTVSTQRQNVNVNAPRSSPFLLLPSLFSLRFSFTSPLPCQTASANTAAATRQSYASRFSYFSLLLRAINFSSLFVLCFPYDNDAFGVPSPTFPHPSACRRI
ncbi:hypothetical protein F5888DRAFT_1729277 [Russula emetica]|nr:hypothetical protein F5888DRAFT_1729277 [Russula emetica]